MANGARDLGRCGDKGNGLAQRPTPALAFTANNRQSGARQGAAPSGESMTMIDQDRDQTPWDLDGDKLREECGIFGVIGARDASAVTALGLHALQHRGQ